MAELTHEELKSEHAKVKSQLADVMGEGGSYRSLQVQLDAALQKHQDDAAAHTKAIQDSHDVAAETIQRMQAAHAADLANLKDEHAAALSELQQQHEKELARQQLDLSNKHAAHVAELKSKTLIPALQDLHARKQADLAAQQAAELEALK